MNTKTLLVFKLVILIIWSAGGTVKHVWPSCGKNLTADTLRLEVLIDLSAWWWQGRQKKGDPEGGVPNDGGRWDFQLESAITTSILQATEEWRQKVGGTYESHDPRQWVNY